VVGATGLGETLAEARVKVLDFGIACVRAQAHAIGLAGTIPYMAPELFAELYPAR